MEKYTESYKIKYFDVDAKNRLKISNLLDLVLEVSNQQTIRWGLSAADLLKEKQGWVVTQYHIEITKTPKVGDEVQIETAATGYNKFFCYRDFWIRDISGNELVHITSIWVIMDLEQRKMVKLDESFGEITKTPLLAKIPKLPRIKLPDISDEGHTYRVRLYDIDGNMHVNNTHYLEWMIDQLPLEFVLDYHLKVIDIKFEHEIVFKNQPTSFVKVEQDETKATSYHLIENNDKKASEAIFTWTK